MNEQEKINNTSEEVNEETVNDSAPPAEEVISEQVSPTSEKSEPYDDGWQPYDPNKKYTNNWSAQGAGKKKNTGKTLLVFALVIIVIGGFCLSVLGGVLLFNVIDLPDIFGGYTETSQSEQEVSESGNIENETSLIPTDNPDLDMNITDYDKVSTEYTELYENCSVSCVSIICTSERSYGYSLGSGFVLSKDGYIATNHHVIDGADKITVRFYDGKEYNAELIGSDSITDLAVLRINATNLTPASLGDSEKVSVGEPVVAIGTPYDLSLAGTMTSGVVSGLARDVECTDDYGNVVKTMTLIQTDASINPGNSGGPLFNMHGQVIGINTLKLMDEYEGIGFSIPITDAIQVFEQLVKYGELPDYGDTDFVKTSPKLHITVMTVSDAKQSAEYGRFIAENAPDGVYVIEVTPGTAIYEAGLEMYDIITEFNGTALESKEDLSAELAKCKAGETVTVKVYHRGQYRTLTFKLDKAA